MQTSTSSSPLLRPFYSNPATINAQGMMRPNHPLFRNVRHANNIRPILSPARAFSPPFIPTPSFLTIVRRKFLILKTELSASSSSTTVVPRRRPELPNINIGLTSRQMLASELNGSETLRFSMGGALMAYGSTGINQIIEVIKTRRQVGPIAKPAAGTIRLTYGSVWQALFDIPLPKGESLSVSEAIVRSYAQEGLFGTMNKITSGYWPSATGKWPVYALSILIKERLPEDPALGSLLGGLAATIFMGPTETLKTMRQLGVVDKIIASDPKRKWTNMQLYKEITKLVINGEIRLGTTAFVLRETLFSGSMNYGRLFFSGIMPNPLLADVASGFLCGVFTNPLDSLKSNMQAGTAGKGYNTLGTIKKLTGNYSHWGPFLDGLFERGFFVMGTVVGVNFLRDVFTFLLMKDQTK